MSKDVNYIYFVEGETEGKTIKILKQNYIESGKVVVLNDESSIFAGYKNTSNKIKKR